MLKHRIIPVLMFNKQLQVVQTTQFKRPYRNCGSLMQHIENMEQRNIDELILLDIDATKENRKPQFEAIKEFTSKLFCPVTIGGGISELDDISKLIQECGADKVAICDACLSNPKFIESAAKKFGSQAIVGVINTISFGTYFVMNGTYTDYTTFSPWYYGKELQQLGCGEILLTAIHKNGLQKGYDLILTDEFKEFTILPIIINGGCGEPNHMIEAIKAGASAVAASSMFLFTEHTPRSCAKDLKEAGIPVRLDPIYNIEDQATDILVAHGLPREAASKIAKEAKGAGELG